MFSNSIKMTQSVLMTVLILMFSIGLSACDGAKPPELMKAVKQFDSDATRDEHVKYMRINHMDALLHKRDQTLINGIRTKKNSLKACINCHVPEIHNGEILRHTNPEHFCSTCHNFVTQKLDCFECHVDHPVSSNDSAKAPNDSTHTTFSLNKAEVGMLAVNTQTNVVTENSETQKLEPEVATKKLFTKKESASE